MQIHTVKAGETLYSIARDYGISPKKLAEINGLKNPDKITVGRELLILFPRRTYSVRRRDTTDEISKRFSIDKNEIFRSNPTLCGSDKIYPEEILSLGYCDRSGGAALVEGYLYNGCARDRLALALPYLSSVCPSSLIYERGRLRRIFNFNCYDIKSQGKRINQRFYSATPMTEGELTEKTAELFINTAKENGASAITLAMNGAINDKGFEAFISYLTDMAKKDALTLCLETDGALPDTVAKIPDRLIITDSEEVRRDLYTALADKIGGAKIVMDLSPFARLGGEALPIEEALRIADEKGIPLTLSDNGNLTGVLGKKEISIPSMKKTKAKLDLIGELGLLGVAIDIMRCPVSVIMMLNSLYELNPSYFSGGI